VRFRRLSAGPLGVLKIVTRKKVLLATTAVWIALVAVAIYLPSAAVMHGPRDDREAYVYSWSLQIGSRILVEGPIFLGILALMLMLEWAGFEWFIRRRQRRGLSP
jgi:hypothetical protein